MTIMIDRINVVDTAQELVDELFENYDFTSMTGKLRKINPSLFYCKEMGVLYAVLDNVNLNAIADIGMQTPLNPDCYISDSGHLFQNDKKCTFIEFVYNNSIYSFVFA